MVRLLLPNGERVEWSERKYNRYVKQASRQALKPMPSVIRPSQDISILRVP